MNNPRWSDLLGRPQVADLEQISLVDALRSGHVGHIASAAIQSSPSGENALVEAAVVLADHGPLDGVATVLYAALRSLSDHQGTRSALPLARAFDSVAERLRAPAVSLAPASRAWSDLAGAVWARDAAGANERIAALQASGASVEVACDELIGALYQTAAVTAHYTPVLVAAVSLAQIATDDSAWPILRSAASGLSLAAPDETSPGPEELDAQALQAIWEAQSEERSGAFQESRFRPHLLGARADVRRKALTKALGFGVPRRLVADSLCLAAASRTLQFDRAKARSARVAETWFDMGWLLQIAAGVRRLLVLKDTPQWLTLLFAVADMVGGAHELMGDPLFELPEPPAAQRNWDHGPQIAAITEAILAGQSDAAIATLRGYLLMVLPEQPLCSGMLATTMEDRASSAVEQGQVMACVAAALEAFGACASSGHRELLPCAAIMLAVHGPQHRSLFRLTHRLVDAREGGRLVRDPVTLPWVDRRDV